MDESAITVRYAKAIFSLAKEKNQLSSLKEDMDLISNACSQSEDFILLLKSPVVKTSEKVHIIKLIFQKKISALSLQFLELVTQNNREVFIPLICRNVLTLIRKEKNIKTAVITTAQEMDKKLLEKAAKILENELGTQVELSAKVNPHLIGGMILRIDNKQYDASILTKLNKIKQEMLKTQL
ncbi:MAG: ATP synthase F1 subunit delta [Mariniphaga sp.]|jgi:F-type H+-transporting ATPase subunit delta|nr:ATP synthase F1 subunit delta [Mariniphaga sp.]